MKWIDNVQKRLYLTSAVILLIGLVTSTLIYLSAAIESDNEMILDPSNSKAYLHDMELYGGKANLLVNQLTNWIAGVWHGKALAYTIGCITVFISLLVLYIAYHSHDESEYDDRNESKVGRTE